MMEAEETVRKQILVVLLLGPLSGLPPGWGQEKGVGIEIHSNQSPADYYPKLHALCMGINDYASSQIPDLAYAENDARDVAQLLQEEFAFQDVRTLTGNQATRQAILDSVAAFFNLDVVSKGDGLLLYFSGHGQTVDLPNGGEMGFLIPQDAQIQLNGSPDVSGYYRSCIAMDEIKRWRSLTPAHHVLVVADACYSGLLASDRALRGPVQDALRLSVCQILTAGTRNQKAREESSLGHGAYTYKLLEVLRTGAADMNKDGFIRATELGQYLRDVNLEGQTPQCKVMDGDGDFIFMARRPPEEITVPSKPVSMATPTPAVQVVGESEMGGRVFRGQESPQVACLGDEWEWPLPDGNYYTLCFVPAGKFQMGSTRAEIDAVPEWLKSNFNLNMLEKGKLFLEWEYPQHEVDVSAFWMGKYEVTVDQFRAFVELKNYKTEAEQGGFSFVWNFPEGTEKKAGVNWRNPGFEQGGNHPVVCVSWNDVKAYMEWAGLCPPSEAEWEKAARGTDNRRFPWGNENPNGSQCNFADRNTSFAWSARLVDDGYGYTSPVGAYPHGRSPYGCYDMAGNVMEWCEDEWYENYEGAPADGSARKAGSLARVCRGGSWNLFPIWVRSANRFRLVPVFRSFILGFRACKPVSDFNL